MNFTELIFCDLTSLWENLIGFRSRAPVRVGLQKNVISKVLLFWGRGHSHSASIWLDNKLYSAWWVINISDWFTENEGFQCKPSGICIANHVLTKLTDDEEDHEADDEEGWAADKHVPGEVNKRRKQKRRPEEEVQQRPNSTFGFNGGSRVTSLLLIIFLQCILEIQTLNYSARQSNRCILDLCVSDLLLVELVQPISTLLFIIWNLLNRKTSADG